MRSSVPSSSSSSSSASVRRCSSRTADKRHPFMDHKAWLAFSARSCFLAAATAAAVNEFSRRKVSNKSPTETRVPRHRRDRHAKGAFRDFPRRQYYFKTFVHGSRLRRPPRLSVLLLKITRIYRLIGAIRVQRARATNESDRR